MQREITVNEFANEVNSLDEINEPIIVKRNNKQDLVVISLEEYKKQLFLTKISSKLEKSKQEVAQVKFIVQEQYLRILLHIETEISNYKNNVFLQNVVFSLCKRINYTKKHILYKTKVRYNICF